MRKLLDQTRLCIIPVVNPDGYEICRKGYGTVRNPIFRQMLKMQDVPCDEFVCNARGMDPALNFPTSFCNRKKIHQQPASENETKALIRIFQEYGSRGLLVFCGSGKKIIYYRIFCWSERLSPGASSEKMYKRKTGTIFYGL